MLTPEEIANDSRAFTTCCDSSQGEARDQTVQMEGHVVVTVRQHLDGYRGFKVQMSARHSTI
jgi:hypothetical protein